MEENQKRANDRLRRNSKVNKERMIEDKKKIRLLLFQFGRKKGKEKRIV